MVPLKAAFANGSGHVHCIDPSWNGGGMGWVRMGDGGVGEAVCARVISKKSEPCVRECMWMETLKYEQQMFDVRETV